MWLEKNDWSVIIYCDLIYWSIKPFQYNFIDKIIVKLWSNRIHFLNDCQIDLSRNNNLLIKLTRCLNSITNLRIVGLMTWWLQFTAGCIGISDLNGQIEELTNAFTVSALKSFDLSRWNSPVTAKKRQVFRIIDQAHSRRTSEDENTIDTALQNYIINVGMHCSLFCSARKLSAFIAIRQHKETNQKQNMSYAKSTKVLVSSRRGKQKY